MKIGLGTQAHRRACRTTGLDVSLKETKLQVLDEVGNRVWRGRCATEPTAIAAAIRALARRTDETLTEVVINALRERLERELRKEQSIESLVEDVMEIGRHCASLAADATDNSTLDNVLERPQVPVRCYCRSHLNPRPKRGKAR